MCRLQAQRRLRCETVTMPHYCPAFRHLSGPRPMRPKMILAGFWIRRWFSLDSPTRRRFTITRNWNSMLF